MDMMNWSNTVEKGEWGVLWRGAGGRGGEGRRGLMGEPAAGHASWLVG